MEKINERINVSFSKSFCSKKVPFMRMDEKDGEEEIRELLKSGRWIHL